MNPITINTSYHRLAGTSSYLAGSIEAQSDGGVGWRREMSKMLEQFDVNVLDPTNGSFKELSDTKANQNLFTDLKLTGRYDELIQLGNDLIRQPDMRSVDKADFIICYVDSKQSFGTAEEIGWANRSKKPILIYCPYGKKYLQSWLFFQLKIHQWFFETIDEIESYLTSVDEDEIINTHGRWVFLKKYIDKGYCSAKYT